MFLQIIQKMKRRVEILQTSWVSGGLSGNRNGMWIYHLVMVDIVFT